MKTIDAMRLELADLDTIRRSIETIAKENPKTQRSERLNAFSSELVKIIKNNKLMEHARSNEIDLLEKEIQKIGLSIKKVRSCLLNESSIRIKSKRSMRIAELSIKLGRILIDIIPNDTSFFSMFCFDPSYHFCDKCNLSTFN